MLNGLWVLLPSVLAGFTQTVTGFGGGIVVMLFFPLFLSVTGATSLNCFMLIWINLVQCWKYRRYIHWKKLLLPCGIYLLVSAGAIYLSTLVDVASMKAWLGLFLVAAAIYFIFFSERIHLRINLATTVLCVTLSGLADGFFGIGGPPMVLYFMALYGEEKACYLGNIQAFFCVTGLYNLMVRAVNGLITGQTLLLAIPGIIGLLLGKALGGPLISRIDGAVFRRVVYFFLAAAGLIIFFTNL